MQYGARSRDEGRVRALWARGIFKRRFSRERHRRMSNYLYTSLAPSKLRPRGRGERILLESSLRNIFPRMTRETLRIIETFRDVPSNCPRKGDGGKLWRTKLTREYPSLSRRETIARELLVPRDIRLLESTQDLRFSRHVLRQLAGTRLSPEILGKFLLFSLNVLSGKSPRTSDLVSCQEGDRESFYLLLIEWKRCLAATWIVPKLRKPRATTSIRTETA